MTELIEKDTSFDVAGDVKPLTYYNITQATCEHYNVTSSNSGTHFNYADNAGVTL